MSASLSPLPSPIGGLAARIVSPQRYTPLPTASDVAVVESPPVLAPLPSWASDFVPPVPRVFARPSTLAVLPKPFQLEDDPEKPIRLEIPAPAPARIRRDSRPPEIAPESFQSTPAPSADFIDYTDDDLREAFGPIVEHAVRNAVYSKENGMDTYLEPMLRATIRRALAEYSPASRPFKPPGAFDRFVWHLQALFTSRTYEDILFDKTHRFQVEEVFLLDAATLALVSFASCDPARHSSAKRVSGTVQRLALQVRDESGKIREAFELPESRNIVARAGRHVVLMAVVRGVPNELVLSDLEFALRRIEDRFRDQFKQDGSPLLHPLQPFLEDCLLIQSPASAA